jgi:hypothetical protein
MILDYSYGFNCIRELVWLVYIPNANGLVITAREKETCIHGVP